MLLRELVSRFASDGDLVEPKPNSVNPLDESIGPALMERAFSDACRDVNERARALDRPLRVHFAFIDSPALGAWSYRCPNDVYLICIAAGAYARLSALCALAAGAGGFDHPQEADAWVNVVGFRDPRLEDLSAVSAILELQPDAVARQTYDRVNSWSACLHFADRWHLFDTATLLRFALAYVFCHEMAHVVCGHLRGLGASRLCETPDGTVSNDSELHHGIELLADSYAGLVLAKSVDSFSWPPFAGSSDLYEECGSRLPSGTEVPALESFFYRVVFSVMLTIFAFDASRSSPLGYSQLTHPHPEVRYSAFLTEVHAQLAGRDQITAWERATARASHDLQWCLHSLQLGGIMFRHSKRTPEFMDREMQKAYGFRAAARAVTDPYCMVELVPQSYFTDYEWETSNEPSEAQERIGESDRPTYRRRLVGVCDPGGELSSSLRRILSDDEVLVYEDAADVSEDAGLLEALDRSQDLKEDFFGKVRHFVVRTDSLESLSVLQSSLGRLIRGRLQSVTIVGDIETAAALLAANQDARLADLQVDGKLLALPHFRPAEFLARIREIDAP